MQQEGVCFALLLSPQAVQRKTHLRSVRASIGARHENELDRVKALLIVMKQCSSLGNSSQGNDSTFHDDPTLYTYLNDTLEEIQTTNPELAKWLSLLILIWIEEERYPDEKEEKRVVDTAKEVLAYMLSKGCQFPYPADPYIHNTMCLYANTRLQYEISWFWKPETAPLVSKLQKDLSLIEKGVPEFQRQLGPIVAQCKARAAGEGKELEDIYALFVVGINEVLEDNIQNAQRVCAQLISTLDVFQQLHDKHQDIDTMKEMAQSLMDKVKKMETEAASKSNASHLTVPLAQIPQSELVGPLEGRKWMDIQRYMCSSCRAQFPEDALEVSESDADDAFMAEMESVPLCGKVEPGNDREGTMVFKMTIACPSCEEDSLTIRVHADVCVEVNEAYEVEEIEESTYCVVSPTTPLTDFET